MATGGLGSSIQKHIMHTVSKELHELGKVPVRLLLPSDKYSMDPCRQAVCCMHSVGADLQNGFGSRATSKHCLPI